MLAVYYQKSKKQNKTKENNKEKKTLAKGIKILLKRGKTKNTNTLGKKEKKKNDNKTKNKNIPVNNIRISQKMKNKD